MKTEMESELEMLAEVMETVLKQDKLFAYGAKMMMKAVKALVEEGFSWEEAIQIATVQGAMVKAGK
jgi:hypothetical protein